MVVVFYGTSAELIKLLGLVKTIKPNQLFLICTAQQREQIEQFHKQYDISPDLYLAQGWRGRDVLNILEMLGFMIKVHINFVRKYNHIRNAYRSTDKEYGTKSVAVVHGDTLTTVVGSYFGRLLRLKVAHIEAGLRSGNMFHPFPEEMDRRIVAKIARIHFSPNQTAVTNLSREGVKGDIIDTKYNTAKDAIEIAVKHKSKFVNTLHIPKKYGLISIHRTELLERKRDFKNFLEIINKLSSKKNTIVFLDHSTTKDKIKVLGLDYLLKKEGIVRVPKLAYMDFIQIAKNADYIVTDSGGLQEDAYFLGVPTMIHRLTTERGEGLGLNAELSYLDINKVEEFIKSKYTRKTSIIAQDRTSPSKIITTYLKKHKIII